MLAEQCKFISNLFALDERPRGDFDNQIFEAEAISLARLSLSILILSSFVTVAAGICFESP